MKLCSTFIAQVLLLSMRYLLHVWSLIPISELHPLYNKSYPFYQKNSFIYRAKMFYETLGNFFGSRKKNVGNQIFIFYILRMKSKVRDNRVPFVFGWKSNSGSELKCSQVEFCSCCCFCCCVAAAAIITIFPSEMIGDNNRNRKLVQF